MTARRELWSVLACLPALWLTGCFGGGVRALDEREAKYYQALQAELVRGQDDFTAGLNNTAAADTAAQFEIARLREKIEAAKAVYSVREVLQAPAGDRAPFIQETRNKVILYHLADVAASDHAAREQLLSALEEQRRAVRETPAKLLATLKEVIAADQILHNYLNQSPSASLNDIVTEVGRQVAAFNGEIKTADQSNAAIKQMESAGNAAAQNVGQVETDLSKFVDVWNKLNHP